MAIKNLRHWSVQKRARRRYRLEQRSIARNLTRIHIGATPYLDLPWPADRRAGGGNGVERQIRILAREQSAIEGEMHLILDGMRRVWTAGNMGRGQGRLAQDRVCRRTKRQCLQPVEYRASAIDGIDSEPRRTAVRRLAADHDFNIDAALIGEAHPIV